MKKIKWANKELPGLSHDDLLKLTDKKLAWQNNGTILGNRNVKERNIGSNIGTYESRSRGQRNSIINQKKSGKLDTWRMKGTNTAAILKKKQTLKETLDFYNLIALDEFKLNQVSHLARSVKHARKYLNDESRYEFIGFRNKSKVYRKLK